MTPVRFVIFLTLLTLLPGSIRPLEAVEELHLRNGDRVTGRLISRDDGKITFESDFFGVLTIDEIDAAVVELPETPVESLAGLPPTRTPSRTETAATITGAATGSLPAAAKVAPPATTTMAKPTSAPSTAAGGAQRWKGKVEFGFLDQNGRNRRTDLSLRGETERKIGPKNQLRAEGRILYAKTRNTVSTDRQDALFRWRHNLTDRMFGQSQTSYLSNDVQKINLNLEQNFGLGYRLFDRDRHVLNVGGGLTAQYRESPLHENGWAYLIEAFQDYTWKLNGRITFTQNANAFISPEQFGSRNLVSSTMVSDAGNYRIRFNSALQGKVTERISMNLRLELEHDATIENEDLRNDRRITSSIGYAF